MTVSDDELREWFRLGREYAVISTEAVSNEKRGHDVTLHILKMTFLHDQRMSFVRDHSPLPAIDPEDIKHAIDPDAEEWDI